MKKIRIVACVLAALLVLTNASVWEGAAASSSNGDLPETGFYAATNSFPRNTVVDVTNLETGKTVQVIVAAGLDNPGLLTILSRDAANAIGMQSRSIGRVRMTQPADPIAFSRFTEGLNSSGDPDRDPKAMVTSNTPAGASTGSSAPDETVSVDSTVISDIPPADSSSTVPKEPAVTEKNSAALTENSSASEEPVVSRETLSQTPLEKTPDSGDSLTPSSVALVPGGETGADKDKKEETARKEDPPEDPVEENAHITDLPESYKPPRAREDDDGVSPEPGPELAWIVPEEREVKTVTEKTVTEKQEQETVTEKTVTEETRKDTGHTETPESSATPAGKKIQETEKTETPEISEVPPREKNTADIEKYELTLVPAEERPPEATDYTELPPESEVAPLPDASLAALPPKDEKDASRLIDPARIIDPVEEKSEAKIEEKPPVEETTLLPGELASGSVTKQEELPSGLVFSVPVINSLEKGKYYLQLGAFSKAEAVEPELTRIGKTYPLTVQNSGSREKPVYRILLGPVNLGESGALLQRFKGIGYGDAFIRSGS
jgi:hypothetical protein